MDANRRQGGIQQLLAAEQEAQQIVNAARSAKSARLRQAKEEAEREIAEYRAQMEAEFQRKVAESTGDSGANVKRLEQETDTKIAQLKEQAANVSPEVIQMLLRHVTTHILVDVIYGAAKWVIQKDDESETATSMEHHAARGRPTVAQPCWCRCRCRASLVHRAARVAQ
uniref:V-type proton ATPase subunit G n=1 Tax=Oryza punctata TaxID=4537 RepID=A0A0E0K421_ORYPU